MTEREAKAAVKATAPKARCTHVRTQTIGHCMYRIYSDGTKLHAEEGFWTRTEAWNAALAYNSVEAITNRLCMVAQ